MSNKENIDFHLLQKSSESSTTCHNKPPLPQKGGRKRKGSHSVLSSIKNIIWTPFAKRSKSEKMGSICIKGSGLESHFGQQIPPRNRCISKVSPSSNTLAVPINDPSTKVMFYRSDVNIDQVSDFTQNDGDQKIDVDKNIEDLDLYPEVFEEAKTIKTEPNGQIENMETASTSSTLETADGKDSIEFKLKPIITSGNKQTSLPNLRSHSASSTRTKRFSQGDTLKMCMGSANLLETKNTFIEKRVRSVGKFTTENVRNVEKRRKRLPTVENGVHVLDEGQVNYYQVLEEIGRGSFGSVCKCKSHKDNKDYAMKIISKKRLMRKNRQLTRKPGSKSNPLEPLYREVAILKKMDHPNVVKLIEVIDDIEVDNFYMIFELMTNGVVIDIPTDEPIPEERARQLFRDLVLGIEYLHYSKIIHRDIKPSNLLIDDNDHVKIADFGVSNMFEGDNDLLSKNAGSPAFQAPEVLDYDAHDRYSGKAADIWAMGITLYCFLYGKCPFFSESFGELSDMIKNNLVSFPDSPMVSPQVFDLISRMLSKQAKDRITMVEIKEHPWVTEGGSYSLPSTEDHCSVIEVTEEEVRNSIKIISKLSSLVIAKSILKGKSFLKGKQQSRTAR